MRGGNGPYFLEAQLVRWPGSHQIVHEFTTGVTDVTRGLGRQRRRRTSTPSGSAPTRSCATARTLIARGALTRDDVIALDNEAAVTIAKARAFAEASPYPKPEAALTGVFVTA